MSPHQISMKSKIAQEKEKIPHILHKKANDSATDQYRHRRPRKFQTPLQKDVLENTLKCGMEVGLITPPGKKLSGTSYSSSN
uniref:Uncharacterized protein n=1 Tax=Arundo donax TaxID=35708 RepID=A0A0A9DG43_ARUDO